MTNLEKFQEYLKALPSPDHFIDWNYYFAVSSCLGRRVWFNPLDFHPIFLNMFIVFVGGPGVGKSLPANYVKKLLKTLTVDPYAENEKADKAADQLLGTTRSGRAITLAPDDCSVEKLINVMAKGTKFFSYFNEETQKNEKVGHSSMIACVSEELATLFREKQTVLIQFLNHMYNCQDYSRKTEKHGEQVIGNPFFNLLGCAVPEWVGRNFNEDLLGTGFASRTLFIYGDKPRHNVGILRKPEGDAGESLIRDVKEHFRELCSLKGRVHLTPEAEELYDDVAPKLRDKVLNPDKKILDYYERKRIHWMKLALCMHFGESTEMLVQRETFEKALEFLESNELEMHKALASVDRHPIHVVTDVIKGLLSFGDSMDMDQLLAHTFLEGGSDPEQTTEKAVTYLVKTKQIKATTNNSGYVTYSMEE